MYVLSVSVPISWNCLTLERCIVVDIGAVGDSKKGWICDCGKWVKGVDRFHKNFVFGGRFVYY